MFNASIISLEAVAFLDWEWLDLRVKLAPQSFIIIIIIIIMTIMAPVRHHHHHHHDHHDHHGNGQLSSNSKFLL